MPFWTSSGVLELRDYVPRLTHTPLSAAAPRGSLRCRIAAHHGLGRRVGERVLAGRADAPLLHVRVRRRRRGAARALRRPLRQLPRALCSDLPSATLTANEGWKQCEVLATRWRHVPSSTPARA